MSLPRDPSGNPKELQLAASGGLLVAGCQVATVAAQIALNGSITPAIDLGTMRLARIAMSAAWDAASLTFQVSYDGVTYNDLYDSTGTEYSVKAAAARAIMVNLADFLGIRWLKIRSGTAAAPVVQTAARTLNLVAVA